MYVWVFMWYSGDLIGRNDVIQSVGQSGGEISTNNRIPMRAI